MPNSVAETRILSMILAQLRDRFPSSLWERQNVVVAHAHGRTVRAGTPGQGDIRGCHGGIFIEIEVKTATGRQSPLQRERQIAVTNAGGKYVLARSLDDVLAALATEDMPHRSGET